MRLRFHHDYGVEDYLDDCKRERFRKFGTPFHSGSTDIATWLNANDVALIEIYLDEFEAWLKLQL
jgi:hypothetical protein